MNVLTYATVVRDPAECLRKLERVLQVAESLGTLDARLVGRAPDAIFEGRLQEHLREFVWSRVLRTTPAIRSVADGNSRRARTAKGSGACHLEQTQRRAANIDIFEFDDTALRRLVDLANAKAA
jgi:hypothetical protein